MTVSLPATLQSPAAEARSQRNLFVATSPAAGADYTLTLDPRYVWRFLSVRCKFVADANVASREVVLQYLNANSNPFDEMGINTTVTAGNTAYYTFSAFQPEVVATVNSGALVPLHPVFLEGGLQVTLHVVNRQAGDQLSEIRIYAEQFFTDEMR